MLRRTLFSTLSVLLMSCAAHAGKLALVIDDFGYRPKEENQLLQMPPAISVAVLPDAPQASTMASKAHQLGHEVLIHLPMAPLSRQPLEKNTLRPEMSLEEISRIIQQASVKVPYAVGINNHMGSAMTSSLPGMQKVMQVLDEYNYYFLDSMTIGNSQSTRAAESTRVTVIKRRVFLDDSQNEASIRAQFNRAVRLAQRDGWTIAIGHPHPATVRVLQQMLPALPADVTLVRPSQLLNEAQSSNSKPPVATPKPRNPFHGGEICATKHPRQPVAASQALQIIADSIVSSSLVQYVNANFSDLKLDYSDLK